MHEFFEALIPVSFALVAILLLIGIVFFIFSAGRAKKQKAYFEALHQELAPGVSVMFCGGIFGEVVQVKPDEVEIKVDSKCTMCVSRYAIQAIVDKEK